MCGKHVGLGLCEILSIVNGYILWNLGVTATNGKPIQRFSSKNFDKLVYV